MNTTQRLNNVEMVLLNYFLFYGCCAQYNTAFEDWLCRCGVKRSQAQMELSEAIETGETALAG